MLKRLEFLIKQARQATDNTDLNGVKTFEIVNYFQQAQDAIVKLILNNNATVKWLAKETLITNVANQDTYDLPTDVYADINILMVQIGSAKPLDQIEESEKTVRSGYYIKGKKIVFSFYPDSIIRVVYVRRLPTLSIRQYKIDNIVGQQLQADLPPDEALDTLDDYVSTVDNDGEILNSGLKISVYNSGTGDTTVVGSIVDTAINDYVVLGKYATTHSELMEECESYMLEFVKRKIYARNSSRDVQVQNGFTEQEKEELIGIFSEAIKDVNYPVLNDFDYLQY